MKLFVGEVAHGEGWCGVFQSSVSKVMMSSVNQIFSSEKGMKFITNLDRRTLRVWTSGIGESNFFVSLGSESKNSNCSLMKKERNSGVFFQESQKKV